ncbi:MAG: serine hydrolase [Planctomycetota bacterium]
MTSSANVDLDAPWLSLPRLDGAPELIDAGPLLDGLFELPAGSALTLVEIEPGTGRLLTARWRNAGETGFYPASTIKWITGALTVAWLHEHRLPATAVVQVGDDPPATVRDLLLDMLSFSGNHAFNVLQETVGLAETHATLRSWGVERSVVRRFFVRPRRSNSRAVRVTPPTGASFEIPARPEADIPLNPSTQGNRESNYFTTDDFVRVAAATLMGPTRHTTYFPMFTQGLSWTNHCYTREGLARLTAERDHRPAFVVLNKPGWWPPDGETSELCYIYNVSGNRHYFLAASLKGPIAQARQTLSEAVYRVFSALSDGQTVFSP